MALYLLVENALIISYLDQIIKLPEGEPKSTPNMS